MARRAAADARGVSAVEFALLAPVLLLLVLGGLELAHTTYVNTVLIGQLQKAGRDMSLEGASSPAQQAAVEAEVTAAVKKLNSAANVTYELKSYHDYANAKSPAEEFNDANHDGVCNNHESFVDSNRNGHWDADGATTGRGGAKDVLLLTATATYPRLALGAFFASSPTVTLKASTLLRNQPSDAQETPPTGTCP
jgi:Flp pilus assembly protein TadG